MSEKMTRGEGIGLSNLRSLKRLHDHDVSEAPCSACGCPVRRDEVAVLLGGEDGRWMHKRCADLADLRRRANRAGSDTPAARARLSNARRQLDALNARIR